MTPIYREDDIEDLHAFLGSLPGMAYRCGNTRQRAMAFVSEGVTTLCDYPADALLQGHPHWGDLILPDDREMVWDCVQKALADGTPLDLEYRIRTRDHGVKWVWERGAALASRPESGLIEGFITDVTPQKQTQSQLHAQQEQLTRVDRLTMLGEMMAGIAHEINQPLTAISTYAHSALRFLEQGNPKPDRLHTALEKMSLETRRAGAVVERIREFARASAQQNVRVNCNKVIQQAVQLARFQARAHNIQLQVELADDLGVVWGDPIHLQQLVLHLIQNAIDAMEIDTQGEERDILVQSSNEPGGLIKLAVVDSGHGVSEAQAAELFRPFSTHRSSRVGLGLLTGRSIATAHGGQLNFANNPDGGATFFVTLPTIEKEKTHEQ